MTKDFENYTAHLSPTIFLSLWFFLFFPVFKWIVDILTTTIKVEGTTVTAKRGLINIKTADIQINSIESIVIEQSILDKILMRGTIKITGKGVHHIKIEKLHNPAELKRQIQMRQG